ncbi:hypothetical protein [Peterkaempfera bronchialis]|uniref:Uncharacterized protein n=1 Tax=Peterkaempfera bronchialis TaxID=2126346 RepID=A0A345T510_9ACTN|nr:hypothetical protein [Peterkaempfera bronchialis]AXI81065.1 hypothetical protein C7M71_000970 [Peterkaempfera bronchialis]
MTTGIKGCDNQSNSYVSFVNQEHAGDSQTVNPRSYGDVYAWISQHKERPLSVQTGRGRCVIWDDNWKIKAEWDDGGGEFILANVRRSPQDFGMTVSSTGDITIHER